VWNMATDWDVAVPHRAPDTRMALSSLDKAQNWILPLDKALDNPFQGRICQ